MYTFPDPNRLAFLEDLSKEHLTLSLRIGDKSVEVRIPFRFGEQYMLPPTLEHCLGPALRILYMDIFREKFSELEQKYARLLKKLEEEDL